MISHTHPSYFDTPVSKRPSFKYKGRSQSIPEVSIITPFYNTGDIFWETFHCVINQSFQNFEWIIINDCSSDPGSITLLTEAAQKDKRIKIIQNTENLGPAASRNRGIATAKGDYLFFVDSDDLVELTMIEKCWIFLQVNEEFAFCNSWHTGFGAETYLWSKGFEVGKKLLYENVIQPTFLARKKMFDIVSFDESIKDGFEDWDFWLRCAQAGFWGYTINEFLYWYRRTPNIVQKWKTWDFGEKMQSFKDGLKAKYEERFRFYFPSPKLSHFSKGIPVNKKFAGKLDINPLERTGKKRILLFIPWMSMGGADKFNIDLIRGLTEKEWEITIITTQRSNNPWYSEFSKFTDDIIVLHNYSHEAYFPQVIEYLVTSRSPDSILITNSEFGYYLVPFLKLAFPHIPLADYNHMEEAYWNNGGHPRQSVIYQEHFQKNIVSSNHLKAWMISQGADGNKIEVVTTNSDHKKYGPSEEVRKKVRQGLGVDDNLCLISFSGRITAQKQPKVLINTIFELSKMVKDGYVLAVAGDGPDMSMIRELVKMHGITDKVWFLGELTNSATIELLQASDIFFLPSLWEGISLAVYEAMTAGLPVVGADVGGQRELVIPGTGYLINRSDEATEAKAYASILASLVTNPGLRKKIGNSARERIESQFSLEQMWDKMNALLSNLEFENNSLRVSEIKGALEQVYALMMHEKRVADQLWNDITYIKGQASQDNSVSFHNPDIEEEIRGYKHHIDELTKWYYKEYEVLPLWYKRVGHVIKAFQGHRTFTSLMKKDNSHA